MHVELNIEFIVNLYNKYIYDLKKVRKYQRKLYVQKGYSWLEKLYTQKGYSWLENSSIKRDEPRPEKYTQKGTPRLGKDFLYRVLRPILNFSRRIQKKVRILNPQLDDINAEISYLLIREFKPEIIVEISPCGGWSTSWILNAIKDNGFGKLYSYDLVDDSTRMIPPDLAEGRWTFIKGDVKKQDKLPQQIDYLFIDSDHSADFAHWYIQNIFPKLKSGTLVSVHDVFRTAAPSRGEGEVIIDWLKHRMIKYFTASLAKEKAVYNKIMSIKTKLNIEKSMHFTEYNSMIYFFFT